MLCLNFYTLIFLFVRNVFESDVWCVVHTSRMKSTHNTPNVRVKNFPRTKKDRSIEVWTQHNFKPSFKVVLYLIVWNFIVTVLNCILPQLQL